MSLVEAFTGTAAMAPPRIILYSAPGVGKSTFAHEAGAHIIDCEGGLGQIKSSHKTRTLSTWPEQRKVLVAIAEQPLPEMRVVAIDTIDWLFRRIVEHVIFDLDGKKPGDITNTIGSAHGGYFKARNIVENIVYREVLPLLNAILERGIAVVLLAHAANMKLITPEGFNVQMAAPDLPDYILPAFVEWSDAVFYGESIDSARSMVTQGTNVITAKNRFSLPPRIEMSWAAFCAALNQ